MNIKKYFSRQINKVHKGTKRVGRSIVRVPRSIGRLPSKTYDVASDAVEQALERAVQRVQADIEARVQAIAANVKSQVLKELQQRQTGIMLIASAIAFAVLGGIVACFGIVYLCAALLNVPVWASFIVVSVLFAIVSAILFVLGRKQLSNVHT